MPKSHEFKVTDMNTEEAAESFKESLKDFGESVKDVATNVKDSIVSFTSDMVPEDFVEKMKEKGKAVTHLGSKDKE